MNGPHPPRTVPPSGRAFADSLGRPGGPVWAGAAAIATIVTLAAGPSISRAEATAVSPSGFTARFHVDLKAPPDKAYEAIGHPERWWNPEHTYSHDASHLSMGLQAGDCFCERWAGGSVAHGHVILSLRDSVVRIDAAFGPLQGLGAKGLLTFALKPAGTGTSMDVTYRVSGAPDAGLDKLATVVDGVIGEQVGRLGRLVDTGAP
jgi:uncharacterized protein YndB with AHSA1/START domain